MLNGYGLVVLLIGLLMAFVGLFVSVDLIHYGGGIAALTILFGITNYAREKLT